MGLIMLTVAWCCIQVARSKRPKEVDLRINEWPTSGGRLDTSCAAWHYLDKTRSNQRLLLHHTTAAEEPTRANRIELNHAQPHLFETSAEGSKVHFRSGKKFSVDMAEFIGYHTYVVKDKDNSVTVLRGASITEEDVEAGLADTEESNQDTDHLRTDIFKMQTSLDMGVKKNKDHLDFEVKRLEPLGRQPAALWHTHDVLHTESETLGIDQVKDAGVRIGVSGSHCEEMHKALSNEIWGPKEVDEFSPPSLRRRGLGLHGSTWKVGATKFPLIQYLGQQVLAELQELRQLDSHVKKITGIQEGHGEHLTDLTNISTEISNRCDTVNKDLKAEIKRTANLMSAHSASLLQEVRASFSREVKELAALHSDVQVFLKDAEDSLQDVKESLDSTSRYVEASLHEVRLDIESLDGKRDRDKQVLEDSLGTLQQQAESSATSLEQLGRTLEHFSTVLGLSLKGQRMVIALGVQDFVDRKDTTYVGFKKGHTGGLKFGQGLDSLTDLPISDFPTHRHGISIGPGRSCPVILDRLGATLRDGTRIPCTVTVFPTRLMSTCCRDAAHMAQHDWRQYGLRALRKHGPMSWNEFTKRVGKNAKAPKKLRKEDVRQLQEIQLLDCGYLRLSVEIHLAETAWVGAVVKRLQRQDGLKWKEIQVGFNELTKKKVARLPELFRFDKAKQHVFFVGSQGAAANGDDYAIHDARPCDEGEEEDDSVQDQKKEPEEELAEKEETEEEEQSNLWESRDHSRQAWVRWVASDRGQAGFRKKLMKSNANSPKADILQWLWVETHPPGMWNSLRKAAQTRDWKKFGQIIRKEWVDRGGDEKTCHCLQGSQHCMQVWRGIAEGY
ncbi:unnamed protein product [Symbiodinium sp. KB8]|nr:unnamed protein product [Symbiodinium sp. KB8]